MFAITRACSQGELKSCSCDPEKKGSAKDSKGRFDWGGCSDNIDYGVKFARAFVDAKERKGKDARALMNLHNNRAGRKVGVTAVLAGWGGASSHSSLKSGKAWGKWEGKAPFCLP